MPKPIEGTFPEYFATYIKKVAEDDVLEALHNQQHLMDTFLIAYPKINGILPMLPESGP